MKKRNRIYRPDRVVITGGGTGGHVFPAVAIGHALEPFIGRENLLFLGATGKMEMEKVPEAGFAIRGLPVRGLRGTISLSNLALPFRLLAAFLKAFVIIRRFRPNVVVGVGGFASAPGLLVARLTGIPIVIQEQNSIPGKVNRFFGRRASLICTAFPGMERHFGGRRVVMTGNPVRASLEGAHALRAEGCARFGLNPSRPVVLLVGGSQGAKSLNEAMKIALPELTRHGIQVIWQTGLSFAPAAESFLAQHQFSGVTALPFIREMELAYGAADLVVSRAGALAIAELALVRLPAILVPFPFAAEDHQHYNAASVVNLGGAALIPDGSVRDSLAHKVISMISDEKLLKKMSEHAGLLAMHGAAIRIGKLIRDVCAGYRRFQTDYVIIPEEVRKVYFLGAGGIGMSAIARWFLLKNIEVHGYDRTATPLTRALEKEGAVLHYDDQPELIPSDTDLVVITPAIPSSLEERRSVLQLGVPVVKRAELLGMISRSLKTIAVAGTHGKTSTSSMIIHLLRTAGLPATGFVGGITRNFDTNFIFTPASRFLVVEADEYDRSFLHLAPDFSVITSTDADHLDVYGTHQEMHETFVKFGRLNGNQPLFTGPGVELPFGKETSSYGNNLEGGLWRAENIRDEGLTVVFDLVLDGETLKDVVLGIPGRHNVENGIAAAAAARWAGASNDDIRRGLKTYRGVVRRFDVRVNNEKVLYIDDYAHHPTELDACIGAVRMVAPEKRITGVFQPHLFTRTRDFAQGFAESLSKLDQIILLEIYPAREEPIPGVDAAMLFELIKNPNKVLLKKEEVVPYLAGHHPEVMLTLGAGDIDTLVPVLTEHFNKEGRA
jgi:UDP-N-acetylmuramate--alanine ligase